jgi:murein L,D-transpeptidase YafK
MHRAILGFLVAVLLGFTACERDKAEISAEHADRILILKSAHTLSLMRSDQPLRTYKVALGRNPIGPKSRKGDHRTPEGHYIIDAKKEHSRFYRALHISYPEAGDKNRALKEGYDPGGDVEIHGIESGLGWIGRLHRSIDWTDGCIAVTDEEMDQIWNSVGVGTPVEIRP